MVTHLCLFTLRVLGLAVETLCFPRFTEADVRLRVPLPGLACFLGDRAVCCIRRELLCFSSNSPILAFRSATGIRFMRLSIRDRRSCAWRAYCARSLRARSVTAPCVSRWRIQSIEKTILSSCKLSIRACFCLRVIRSFF